MSENKTRPTDSSVKAFLDNIADEQRRRDCLELADMMQYITNAEPIMWGSSIVGFGQYHYKYASGREGDSLIVGFSPRKGDLTLYLSSSVLGDDALLSKLGKYKVGKACLYVKRLDDVHRPTLKRLIQRCVGQTIKANR
jgi:hypothetical protein